MSKKNSVKQEISLISLELENYRQYYGKQLVEFQTRDDGFTTIVGENGEGKSNLLNAMNWCFYKNEPHGKKDPKTKKPLGTAAPIVNSSYIKELKSETTGKVSVRVNLKVGDTTYSIYRNQTILVHKLEYEKTPGGLEIMKYREFEHEDKVPAGCELVENMSGLNIEQKGKDDLDFHPIDNTKFDTIISQILPKSLSVFLVQ